MARNIKVRDDTYQTLRALMRPEDTFDSVIKRLFENVIALNEALSKCEEEKEAIKKAIAEKKATEEVDAIDLDKAAWYTTKVLFSIQALKDLVEAEASAMEIDRQLNRVLKNLDQVRERYGINVRTVKEIVTQYVNEPTKENKILLNEATKELVKSIFIKMLSLQVLR